MSKQDFIALADAIKEHNQRKRNVWGHNAERMCFNIEQAEALADFCKGQNSAFNRERWMDYIAGECGPSGGRVKK